MRADNLGLGAKTGSGQEAGECVGLDAFQAMLGRLNGKSEEVLGKEQEVRDEMKLRAHVERKGMVRFVYGGRLVGDEYEDGEEGKSKAVPVAPAAEKERKNDKKEKKSRIGGVEQSESTAEASRNEEEASTEKKKIKKRKKVADGDEEPIAMSKLAPETTSEEASNSEDEATQKARRKAERAERRERKRQRREAKAAKLAEAGRDDENMPMRTVPAAPVEAEKKVLTVQLSPSTTAVSATVGGRHMSVRSRYIAAKRRAVMDPQALKEVCFKLRASQLLLLTDFGQILMVKA